MRVCDACHTTLYDEAWPGARDIPDPARFRLGSPAEAARVLGFLKRKSTERLIVILTDAQNCMIGKPITVSQGSLNTTRTNPREVFHPAIKKNAVAIIIAHNHPSGNLEPSRDDIEFTNTIAKAAVLLGITLHDHLIVSRRGFVGMRDRGLL